MWPCLVQKGAILRRRIFLLFICSVCGILVVETHKLDAADIRVSLQSAYAPYIERPVHPKKIDEYSETKQIQIPLNNYESCFVLCRLFSQLASWE